MIQEALMAAFANKANQSNTEPTEETPDVGKIKEDWNDFLGWLEKKGVKGKPELDKGELGNIYFKQYIKEHPQTSLSEKVIPIVRSEYKNLQGAEWKKIQENKAMLQSSVGYVSGKDAEKYKEEHMRHITLNEASTYPNYVGQHLTQTFFPGTKGEVATKQGEMKSTKILTPGFIENVAPAQKSTKVTLIPSKQTPIKVLQKQ